MKKYNYLTAAVAAICSVSLSFQALAGYAPAGPGADPETPKYSEEHLARLEDNVLEYDEIDERIENYNTTMSNMWDAYNKSKTDMQNVVTSLESDYRSIKSTADAYKALGAGAMGTLYENSYKSVIAGFRKNLNGWDLDKNKPATIRQYQKQFVSGAQSAMIGYDTVCQNMDTLNTMVQLYQKQYDMTQRMQSLGLATDQDLLSAKSSLLSAQSQLLSLQNQKEDVRRKLCLLLGYDPDANPDIRPMPEFDMSRLDGMNLEADTKKAIGNNYTLIKQRTSAAGNTNAQTANRLKVIAEGDEKLTIEMKQLYQDVMDSKAAYDAAVTGLAAAEISRDTAERQFANGLTSEMQYTGQMISYYQKKAAKESANLSLWQAMETYNWGVEGLATVE